MGNKNRYLIKEQVVQVEFFDESVVNMKGQVCIHIGDKEIIIPIEDLELIAEPAP